MKNFEAHAYQRYAIDYIVEHKKAGLFLDMGLGKTVITLSAIAEIMLNRFEVAKTLIIAPKRVAESTWPREISKWDHLRHLKYSLVLGTEKERKAALDKAAHLYIVNCENVPWLVQQGSFDFDMLVIDELSSFKSPKALRFKALKKVRASLPRIVGLTGTPAPNSLLDLWPQVFLLDGGERFGRFIGKFRDTYFVPDRRNRQIVFSYKPKPGAEKAIYKRLEDLCFSLKTRGHVKMPELIKQNHLVSLDGKERKLYERLKEELVLECGGEEISAANAAVLSNMLLQAAGGAVYKEQSKDYVRLHDRKLEALEDLLAAQNGKSLLVAYWFKHEFERIKARFPKARAIDSPEAIEAWNSGKIEIGLIHPASAGHGLNLQEGGSSLVWYSLTWSLELYQQANARLYRQGQRDKTVLITHIVAEGTMDERVLLALEKKELGQDRLIEAVRAELRV